MKYGLFGVWGRPQVQKPKPLAHCLRLRPQLRLFVSNSGWSLRVCCEFADVGVVMEVFLCAANTGSWNADVWARMGNVSGVPRLPCCSRSSCVKQQLKQRLQSDLLDLFQGCVAGPWTPFRLQTLCPSTLRQHTTQLCCPCSAVLCC